MKTARDLLNAAVSEEAFSTNVRRFATTLGWLDYHTHDSRRSPSGFPDLVLVRRPRMILAELKTTKGELSTEQRVWLWTLADAAYGGDGRWEVYVWTPPLLDRIIEVLK